MLTGATGFVGRALITHLHRLGHECVGVSRAKVEIVSGVVTQAVGDISDDTDWRDLLASVECVIHLAARAHLLNDRVINPQLEFDRVNYHSTMNLVRQAAEAGVKRFVYISSIGVHGASSGDVPFTEVSALAPHSFYAKSKLKAEEGIIRYLKDKPMEWVVVRPPLIYAADAPGNFQLLLKLVRKGLPLPFGNVCNARSMVARENVVDFLTCCASHPRAAREVFVVADGQDSSIGEIVELIGRGMGVRTRLFSAPVSFIKFCARLIGRQNMYVQLFESLQVDAAKAAELLEWRPVVRSDEALIDSGRLFQSGK
ncbi:NAD-dependent epimerase/dehydratase family protein [Pseudomonas sp. NUPR-001]|uniref:NAD-dependent epimerase/dehydratase family protein n=1 Tax=Pseudomonas sp. NUPR-001 TaxID=3416058 RepID=UPI003F97C48C